MKLNIRGDKIQLTKSIKDYIEEKIGKLDKYFNTNNEITCYVVIKVKNDIQTIEVTLPSDKFTIRAEESHVDLYAAIDLIVDKLERMIRKNKTKLNKRYNESLSFESYEEVEEDEEENDLIKIVKRKNIDTKPMGEEEAVLQMQLLNHDFFVFKNIDEECVSVLYIRKDGNYGIINVK